MLKGRTIEQKRKLVEREDYARGGVLMVDKK
jgi:hypothetical protein